MKSFSVKTIALSGMMLAIILVLLFAASMFAYSKLTLTVLCGAALYLSVCTAGIKSSAVMFAASVILGFLLLPNKIVVLIYAICFGPYALIKPAIEKVTGRDRYNGGSKARARFIVAWLIKFAAAAILVAVLFFAFKEAFLKYIGFFDSKYPWLIIALSPFLFIIYDYMLGLVSVIAKKRFAGWK